MTIQFLSFKSLLDMHFQYVAVNLHNQSRSIVGEGLQGKGKYSVGGKAVSPGSSTSDWSLPHLGWSQSHFGFIWSKYRPFLSYVEQTCYKGELWNDTNLELIQHSQHNVIKKKSWYDNEAPKEFHTELKTNRKVITIKMKTNICDKTQHQGTWKLISNLAQPSGWSSNIITTKGKCFQIPSSQLCLFALVVRSRSPSKNSLNI